MLSVLTTTSPRTHYIFKDFIGSFWEIPVQILNNKDDFLSLNTPRINYTNNIINGVVNITPTGLLTENTIKAKYPSVTWQDNYPLLYPTDNPMGFDIFSAIFFMLSRYEEYIDKRRDHHQRFTAYQSIAYNNNFLHLPVVEIWMNQLKHKIQRIFPDFKPKIGQFEILPTFDIDNAFAYHGKGFLRHTAGVVKSLSQFKLQQLKTRSKSIKNPLSDPYNTYQYIERSLNDNPACFFLHLGDYGKYDKSVNHQNPAFNNLIRELSKKYTLGIHPSYRSNYLSSQLNTEIKRFEDLTGNRAITSRQHYLKLDLPSTYQNLADHGIEKDYSMGYADEAGFRAGISRSFTFYNLEEEKSTGLQIQPFCYMDGTYHDYKKITVEEAQKAVGALRETIKKVDGRFCFIWHNDSLRNSEDWAGWRELYEFSLL